MLFITRRLGQTVRIGDDIVITVAPNKPGFGADIITLGIEAPKSIKIMRGELDDKENGKPPRRGKED